MDSISPKFFNYKKPTKEFIYGILKDTKSLVRHNVSYKKYMNDCQEIKVVKLPGIHCINNKSEVLKTHNDYSRFIELTAQSQKDKVVK